MDELNRLFKNEGHLKPYVELDNFGPPVNEVCIDIWNVFLNKVCPNLKSRLDTKIEEIREDHPSFPTQIVHFKLVKYVAFHINISKFSLDDYKTPTKARWHEMKLQMESLLSYKHTHTLNFPEQQRLEKLYKELDKIDRKLKSKNISNLDFEIETLNQSKKSKLDTIDDLQTKLSDLVIAKSTAAQTQNSRLQEIDDLNTSIDQLQTDLASIEEQIKVLRSLKPSISKFIEQTNALDLEVAFLNDEKQKLETEATQTETTKAAFKELNEHLTNLQTRKSNALKLKNILETKEKELENIDAELVQKQNLNNGHNSEVSTLDTEIKDLSQGLANKQAQIQELQTWLQSNPEPRETALRRAKYKEEIQELENELKLKSRAYKTRSKYAAKIPEMDSLISDFRSRNSLIARLVSNGSDVPEGLRSEVIECLKRESGIGVDLRAAGRSVMNDLTSVHHGHDHNTELEVPDLYDLAELVARKS